MTHGRQLHWMSIVGTRPQFIKLAPVCRAIDQYNSIHDDGGVTHTIVNTGQHYDYEMADLLFSQLEIPRADYNLGVGSGSHALQLGQMLLQLEPVLIQDKPDWVLVYGDTNSTLASTIIAARLHVPVAHIEAGCRSYNMGMPEEQNRIATDHLSSLLLAASKVSLSNLVREGIGSADDPLRRKISFIGDLMHDALLQNIKIAETRTAKTFDRLGVKPGSYYLLTLHRAENTDDAENLNRIFSALEHADYPVLFPVHPRTQKLLCSHSLPTNGNLRTVVPLGYLDMLIAEKHSRKVITDSGGVQKEAFYLHVPCITLRSETEWPETLESGANTIVGTDPGAISKALLSPAMQAFNGFAPFGRGDASIRLISELLHYSAQA